MLRFSARLLVGVTLTSLLLVGPAALGAGQKPKERDREAVFKKLDSNSDGKLTIEEMKGKGKRDAAKVEKRFGKLDKDGDKAVTLEEFKATKKKPK
jgi:Ca2+-binding EF-hand superfamily protein